MSMFFNSWLMNIVLVQVLLLLIIVIYFKYAFGYWKRKKIPFLPPSFPFGNMNSLVKKQKNFGEAFAELYVEAKKKSERFVGIYFLAKPYLLLTDPELIKLVLVKNFKSFPGRGIYYNEKHDPLSGNIFQLTGPKWKNIRSKMTPMFSIFKLKTISHLFEVSSKELSIVLEEKSSQSLPIDISDLAERSVMDNVGRTAFGLECNSLREDSELLNWTKYFMEKDSANVTKWALSFFLPKVFDFFKIRIFEEKVTKYFMNLFKETFEARKKSGQVRNDFIDLFIRLANNESIQDDVTMKKEDKNEIKDDNNGRKEEIGFTVEEMAAQAFVTLIAGWETSAGTITFCMYELAKNPKIQETLHKEVLEVLKRFNGKVCYDAVTDMGYLDRVINETLRMYPVLPNLHRECCEDFQLPGSDLVIERGTLVWIPVLGLHHDPEFYPDPEIFDPDRFQDEINPRVYMPFGDGPKNCIGMKFGLVQVKFAVATLLKTHRYTLHNGDQTNTAFATSGFTLKFKDNLLLDAEKMEATF